jgi:hypothetical protein
MKRLGYVLISLAFLAGALTTVLDEELVRWGSFAAALVVGVLGIAVVRISMRREARAEGKLTSNMQAIGDSLERVVGNLERMNRTKDSLDPYEARLRIDALFPDDLNTFVEARESIAHVHGLQAYADVMNYFATGERYLNRVWSASADGYIDEVNEYLEKATEQFVGALRQVRQLESTPT